MKIATLCGISPLDFWELTPYEISLVANSYAKRREEEAEERITLAYMNAMWSIQFLSKNKPKLEKILKKRKKEMTDKEMLNQVRILNNLLGGEVVGG